MYPAAGGAPGQNPPQGPPPPAQRPPWEQNTPQQPYRSDQAYQPLAPVNGSYPPNSRQDHQIRPDRPEMAAIHPHYYQQPPPYLPAPSSLYHAPPQDQYRPPPSASNVGQTAPRQRTAIACKYCRRRKIRCSGFEHSEDGRCSNCIRFSQECVFTPVSAQTQAFVPAQALYGRGARGGATAGAGGAPPQQLYGPYGNRLPPQHEHYPPHPVQQPGYSLPNPTGPYQQPPQQPGASYPYPPGPPHQPYEPGPHQAHGPHPRGREEPPNAPVVPPHQGSGQPQARPREDGNPAGYSYPDPSGYAAAQGGGHPNNGHSASANSNYQQQPQPYYPNQSQARRHSPGSGSPYTYGPNRDSQSPHGAQPYRYGSNPQAQQNYQPPPGQAPTSGGARTPPPLSAGDRSKGGMSIHDMVSESGNGSGERSAADSNMVSALNRPPKR